MILGVSPDDLETHEKFQAKIGIPFTLLTDANGEVSKLYDVWKLQESNGKESYGIERSTFVMDREAILAKEWRKVKVDGHVAEVLAFVKGM
jgi:peroxiredoxin Q/BCP